MLKTKSKKLEDHKRKPSSPAKSTPKRLRITRITSKVTVPNPPTPKSTKAHDSLFKSHWFRCMSLSVSHVISFSLVQDDEAAAADPSAMDAVEEQSDDHGLHVPTPPSSPGADDATKDNQGGEE